MPLNNFHKEKEEKLNNLLDQNLIENRLIDSHTEKRSKAPEDLDLADAMHFLSRVKEEYAHDPSVYDSFLVLMRDYKHGRIEAMEVIKAVGMLFKGNRSIVKAFNEFLPSDFRMLDMRVYDEGRDNRSQVSQKDFQRDFQISNQNLPNNFNKYNNNESNNELNFSNESNFNKNYDFIKNNQYKKDELHNNRNIIDNSSMEFSRSRLDSLDNKNRYSSSINSEYINNFNDDFIKNNSIKHDATVEDELRSESDEKSRQEAQAYIKKVRHRLRHRPDDYRAFLETLSVYQRKAIDDREVVAQLRRIMGDHPDLISGFLEFAPGDMFLEKLRSFLERKNAYEEFLRAVNMKNQGLVSSRDLVVLVKPLIDDEGMMEVVKGYLGYEDVVFDRREKEKMRMVGSYCLLVTGVEDYYADWHKYKEEMHKSEDEMNGSEDEMHRSREEMHKNKEKVGDELDEFFVKHKIPESILEKLEEFKSNDILNNIAFSVPKSFSEETHMRSYFEECLFRVEEERYECEILIDRAAELIITFETLLKEKNIEELSLESFGMPFPLVEETLSYIYGKRTDEIVDQILENPELALPVVLQRLYTMIERWKKEYRGRSEAWREVVINNYYKALDIKGYQYRGLEKKMNSRRAVKRELEKGVMCVIWGQVEAEKVENEVIWDGENYILSDDSWNLVISTKPTSTDTCRTDTCNNENFNPATNENMDPKTENRSTDKIEIDNNEEREAENKEKNKDKIKKEIFVTVKKILTKDSESTEEGRNFAKINLVLDFSLKLLEKDYFDITVDFSVASVMRYILKVFEKINSLTYLPKEKICYSQLSLNLEYATDANIDIFDIESYLSASDKTEFENAVRMQTGGLGYKIFTLEKLIERIYQNAATVDTKKLDFNTGESDKCRVKKDGAVVLMKMCEIFN